MCVCVGGGGGGKVGGFVDGWVGVGVCRCECIPFPFHIGYV